MPKLKMSRDEERRYEEIGKTMCQLRQRNGWSQTELAERLGVSKSHISALEGGQYRFSASLIERMTQVFDRPLGTFLREHYSPNVPFNDWQHLFDQLLPGDQSLLLTLGRKLASWSCPPDIVPAQHKSYRVRGPLVSIEGVDGEHLHQLGTRLLAKAGTSSMVHCPHNYASPLWRYMIRQFSQIDRNRIGHRAIERTILFACERLERFETQIANAIASGKATIVPFYLLAPSVFQQAEGVGDRRIIDILETLLPKPDLIVMLRSNPNLAAKKAVKKAPKAGQFYSPYGRAQFIQAQQLYEKAIVEYQRKGLQTRVFDMPKGVPDAVVDKVFQLVEDIRTIRRK